MFMKGFDGIVLSLLSISISLALYPQVAFNIFDLWLLRALTYHQLELLRPKELKVLQHETRGVSHNGYRNRKMV